jgi:hypothetical protein
LVEHVGAVADVAGLDRGDEGGEVDEFAAAGVDDHGTLRKERETTGVEKSFGLGGELGVK